MLLQNYVLHNLLLIALFAVNDLRPIGGIASLKFVLAWLLAVEMFFVVRVIDSAYRQTIAGSRIQMERVAFLQAFIVATTYAESWQGKREALVKLQLLRNDAKCASTVVHTFPCVSALDHFF